MTRTLVLSCPDWPVAAAGLVDGVPVHEPVAVLAAGRVVACSPAARAEGVRTDLRRREAQSRCPHVVVVGYDEGRDARAFELVVATVEALAPGVDVLRPGACAVAARGPARYFGGEAGAAEHLVEQVAQECGVEAQVGIADGVFAAALAARSGHLVAPGGSPAYLAGIDIAAIGGTATTPATRPVDRDALVDLLRRLGVRTLGDFAALPAADVLARFGADAAFAHRLAAGRDERPLAARRVPLDLDIAEVFDEPLDRVDAAAFAARALGQLLHERLARAGLACTRLGIEAVTEHGEVLHRTWRHDGLLTAAGIGDRVRWQLDGWLRYGAGTTRPTGGIVRLRLVPDGVVVHAGLQLGLWGDAGAERDRAHRAMTRVQGMLGPEAVVTAVLGGGRDPGDQVRLVPWGDERLPTRPEEPPWPGRLPPPAPASVLAEPEPVEVLDADGARVGVTARMVLTGAPAALRAGRPGGRTVAIVDWAGPWPVDEGWWAPAEASRRVRFQLTLADGRALLVCLSGGAWTVEAVYD